MPRHYEVIIETGEMATGRYRANVVEGPQWTKPWSGSMLTRAEAYRELCDRLRSRYPKAQFSFMHVAS